MKRKTVMSTTMLVVFALFAVLVSPASARKTHLFQEEFGNVGHPHFGAIAGLAIDQAGGDLLVIDPSTQSISRWNPDGTPADFSALGTNVIDAKGTGQCPTVPGDCDQTPQDGLLFGIYGPEQQVAVDNSGTATDGDIYVTQGSAGTANVVDIFAASGQYLGQLTGAGTGRFTGLSPCGVAVDSGGHLFVATGSEGKIDEFEPSANPPVNGDAIDAFGGVTTPCNLAAGAGPSAGGLLVRNQGNQPVESVSKINSLTGALEYVVDPAANQFVTVDPVSGHAFTLNHLEYSPTEEVREFDVSGAGGPVTIGSTDATEGDSGLGYRPTRGLAVRGTTGDVYLGKPLGRVLVYGPLVTVPDVTTGATTITGDTSVTLNGTVDPDGVAIEECRFEYGLTDPYQSVPCVETPGEIGTGTDPMPVHADLTGLAVESVYHVRLVAKNVNATIKGSDQTFRTPSKPAIGEEWTGSAGSTNASVKATINPGNSATTFRVEWGADSSYGHSTAEIAVGSDAADHTVSVVLSGLAPATTYHWRVVAGNDLGVDEGSDRSFKTYPEGAPGLPDGRVYELVSPIAKEGGEVAAPGNPGGAAESTAQPQQSSPSGDAITYGSFTAFGIAPESSPATSQYLSRRGPGGWSTANITPPSEMGGFRDPLVGFSADLSHGAVIAGPMPLTDQAAKAVPNLYQRANDSGALTAITTEANQAELPGGCLSYGGTSEDSRVVIFAEGPHLYEWSASSGVRPVDVLPDESLGTAGSSFGINTLGRGCESDGGATSLMRHAISNGGSRIFWTYGGTYSGAVKPLFARVNGSRTIQLDAPNEGVGGKGGEGHYWDASRDGSKVFFTDTKRLTAARTTAGSSDLYLYDFDAPEGERLTDLTAQTGEAADVQGVVGTSDDGSYAYFVAEGVLDPTPNARGESAETGRPNLYAWHSGEEPRFVATLAEGGKGEEGDGSDWVAVPTQQTARVSANGLYVAFLSTRSLTGFDNTSADGSGCSLAKLEAGGEAGGSGSPLCAEVFLYGFEGAALHCVSCNRADTRPLGPAAVPTWSTPFEQPRYLSADGGRLFFETFDRLDPHDTNKGRDVYEFELPGVAGCSTNDPSFAPASGGCIYLISTGQSEDGSYFLDASVDGSDAFISTRQGLVPEDEDGRFDVYDARVDGSRREPPPPGCEGEGCRAGRTSAPAGLAPATGGFRGPGNPVARHRCPAGQRKVRRHGKAGNGHRRIHRHGKARCVKRKKNHVRRHRRAHHKRRTGK